jgi:hypothetical protein
MFDLTRAAHEAGGFAITGSLVESGHGAGIWICPVNVPALELMVPWHYVRCVVTAEAPQAPRVFGLMTDLSQTGAVIR